jgi:anti-sigma factor RsiW
MMGLPTCQEVETCMTDYMEGALPFRKRLGIRIHLMMCDLCSGLYHRLDALSKLAKEMFAPPTTEVPPEALVALNRAVDAIKKTHNHKVQ